jgi:RNA-directed DNA polymerase
VIWQGCNYAHAFGPAVSSKALKTISRTVRRWALHHRSDKALKDLADLYNSYIRGWINYYGQFYRARLKSTLLRIDDYLIRWARRKFKRLRERPKGAREWLAGVRRANPTLFAHWRFFNVGGRTSEAV